MENLKSLYLQVKDNLTFVLTCLAVFAALFALALIFERCVLKQRKKLGSTHFLAYTAIFSAMAGVLMFIEIPLFFAPSFYEIDLSEIPIMICTFYLGPVAGVVAELQNALACAERLFELVEQPPQSPDKADAVTLTDAKGNVAMQNVAFSYVKDRELIKKEFGIE